MKTRLFLLSLLALGVVGAVIFKTATPRQSALPEASAMPSSATTAGDAGSIQPVKTTLANNGQPTVHSSATVAHSDTADSVPPLAPVTRASSSPSTVVAPASVQMAEVSQVPIRVHGEKVVAQMNVKGQSVDLEPNQVGSFPRMLIDLGEKVSVSVQWPDAQAGQRVVAAVEDGGTLNKGQKVLPLNLDERLQVAFDFTAEQSPGIYRITLRHGADTKTLELWAGPELALKSE